MIWKAKTQTITQTPGEPLVMGILNITPDSFSDGGECLTPEAALRRAKVLEEEGADILDIGAESTRPGALPVSLQEEEKRLFPALDLILKNVRIPVSLDTTKAAVADRALASGVLIINDVSGLSADDEMAGVIRKYRSGVILMHRRGTATTMQTLADYADLVPDVIRELGERVAFARAAGIEAEQIAIDPGLGFSKTADQNFEIIRRLREFQCFSRPVVVGPSRKSFLGKVTGREPQERISASVAATVLLAERGAAVLRVHDVRATKDALSITKEVMA